MGFNDDALDILRRIGTDALMQSERCFKRRMRILAAGKNLLMAIFDGPYGTEPIA